MTNNFKFIVHNVLSWFQEVGKQLKRVLHAIVNSTKTFKQNIMTPEPVLKP